MDKVYHPRISMQSLQETYDDLMDICIHICVFICVYHICVFICVYINIDILFSDRKKSGQAVGDFLRRWARTASSVGLSSRSAEAYLGVPVCGVLGHRHVDFPFWCLCCLVGLQQGEKSVYFFEALRIGSQKGCGLPTDKRM